MARGRGGEDRLREKKMSGLEFRLRIYTILLRNNQSKFITYKYDLWKIIIIIIIICNMLNVWNVETRMEKTRQVGTNNNFFSDYIIIILYGYRYRLAVYCRTIV